MFNKDWKKLIKKAWSIRLLLLAGLLTGLEACAPIFEPYFGQRTFAIIVFVIVALAFVSRLLAQKEFK